jgi:Calcineurin-like phosphoesterase
MMRERSKLFTFAIVSDTHIRPRDGDQSSPFPVNLKANARARFAVQEIVRRRPAFTVHLGDMVHPMPSLPTFPLAAAEAHRILAPLDPLKFVPGNHDVGDKPLKGLPAEPATAASLALFEAHFGASWHAFAHAGCQFLVLNASLLNSGLAAEEQQRRWLEAELGRGDGTRRFLFVHYPPFITAANEPSHYDNIDEPGRGWLLELLARHAIEAVFSGHVHHFFYNRHHGSHLYVLPPTSFIRQDYSELFPIAAANEHGRDDIGKYGVTFVDVFEHGHAVRIVPTEGAELGDDEVGRVAVTAAGDAVPTARGGRLVAHLRHAWATPIALPYNGPMEEFSRKRARNDALLMRLWQLGICRLRTPLADLLDPDIRRRIEDFGAAGMRFTFFSLQVPDASTMAALQDVAASEALQIVTAKTDLSDIAVGLANLVALSDLGIVVGKLHSSADEPRHGSNFAHSVSFGFKWPERQEAVAALRACDGKGCVTGLAFQINLGDDLAALLAEMEAFGAANELQIWANVRLASENPAIANFDDQSICARVKAAVAVADNLKRTTVEVDTLIDIDRGYHPRHGLLDRRCNFRSAGRWLAGLDGS